MSIVRVTGDSFRHIRQESKIQSFWTNPQGKTQTFWIYWCIGVRSSLVTWIRPNSDAETKLFTVFTITDQKVGNFRKRTVSKTREGVLV